ncbi:MAG: hypothetical protein M5U01_08300 [Ardenticatenaceae bacterium]|nr:hypothetical protein [Ardenticatenaceae bacterium]
MDSKRAPLYQVADLLAGLVVFSRQKYDAYCVREALQHGQLGLPQSSNPSA